MQSSVGYSISIFYFIFLSFVPRSQSVLRSKNSLLVPHRTVHAFCSSFSSSSSQKMMILYIFSLCVFASSLTLHTHNSRTTKKRGKSYNCRYFLILMLNNTKCNIIEMSICFRAVKKRRMDENMEEKKGWYDESVRESPMMKLWCEVHEACLRRCHRNPNFNTFFIYKWTGCFFTRTNLRSNFNLNLENE